MRLTDTELAAEKIAERYRVSGWVSVAPSTLRIDTAPRIEFRFSDGRQTLHVDVGAARKLADELRFADLTEQAERIERAIGQL